MQSLNKWSSKVVQQIVFKIKHNLLVLKSSTLAKREEASYTHTFRI